MSHAKGPIRGKDAEMSQGAKTILAVDDESIVLSLLRRSLEKAGYQVMVAADGVAALELFQEHHADIAGIILDLSMPKMSGEETFDAIREIEAEVPIILSSGFAEDEAIERFRERGVAGFIQKPFRPLELIGKAEEVFGPALES